MSTFTCLHYHLVFSTKHRLPTILPEWRKDLWKYMSGTCEKLKGHAYEIGGTHDHIHALVSIHQTVAISDFVRDFKASASAWVHKDIGSNELWWQEGYAAFSVSHSALETVRQYILTQEERHQTINFQNELIGFLKRHEVEYDERYIWD